MEKQVVEMMGDTPVVLLVGNIRAVKDSGGEGYRQAACRANK